MPSTSLPSVERSWRTAPRASQAYERGHRPCREVAGRLFSDGLFARRSSSRSTACGRGWSAIVTGADLPVIRRFGRQDLALGGRAPRRPSAWSRPHPRSGTSPRPPGSQPFPLVRVIKVRRAAPREAPPCSRARRSDAGRGGPGRCLTRKGPEVTVRSTSPSLGGLCWASWRQSETGEERWYAEPRSRWSTRPGDGSDAQGEIPGNAWRCKQSREEVDAESEDGAMTLFKRHMGRRVAAVGVAVALLVLGLATPAYAAAPTITSVTPSIRLRVRGHDHRNELPDRGQRWTDDDVTFGGTTGTGEPSIQTPRSRSRSDPVGDWHSDELSSRHNAAGQLRTVHVLDHRGRPPVRASRPSRPRAASWAPRSRSAERFTTAPTEVRFNTSSLVTPTTQARPGHGGRSGGGDHRSDPRVHGCGAAHQRARTSP